MAKKKVIKHEENCIINKDILSIQQLIQPYIGCNDHNRLQMVSSQLTQALWVTNCEPPLVQSIYNKDMVNYSNMVVKAKDDMINHGKIKLQNEEFLLLESEFELELYPIHTPVLSSAFSAHHTYVTDKKKLKQNDPILINGNSDISGNLQIGTNALVGYMVFGDNFEDSAIISESFAKKITHIEKDVVQFVINANEYLLNLYGNKEEYKCFPDVGEYVDKNSRILCAKRMVNHGWNSFIGLSKNSNEKIKFFSDDIYYSKGKVVDISIYSNLDEKPEEEKNDFYRFIEKHMNKNRSDVKHFLSLVNPYLKRYKSKEDKFTFGPNLQYYYNKFRKIDNENVLTLDDKKFNGYLVRITIEREVVGEVGCKIANTHGAFNCY